MRWVVLSNIHTKFAENLKTRDSMGKLIDYLQKDRSQNGAFDFVLITGDIMYRYEPDDSEEYVAQLIRACGIQNEQLYLCPGNHDVYRLDENRNKIIGEARKDLGGPFPVFPAQDPGYDLFSNFYQKIRGEQYEHFLVRESAGNKKYRIIHIDSCLLSNDKMDRNCLRVCAPGLYQLEGQIKDDDYLNIVIMHHSCDWLFQNDNIEFQHWLADRNIDIVFCGHNHVAGQITLEEAVNRHTKANIKEFVCGPCLYGATRVPSFYICNYDEVENIDINIELHVYAPDGNWTMGKNQLRSFPDGVCHYRIPRKNSFHGSGYSHKKDVERRTFQIEQNEVTVYPNIVKAHNDIAKDIRNSRFLKFYGIRGQTFTGGAEKNGITAILHDRKDIIKHFLVSYPFSDNVRERLEAIPGFEDSGSREKKWRENYKNILQLKEEYNVNSEVRFHDTSLLFRLIFTDHCLYLGYYEKGRDSKYTCIYRINSDTPTYQTYYAYFENLWIRARRSLPEVPSEYSFLKGSFSVVPSLVLNINSECGMQCKYCPKGGENLKIIPKDKYVPERNIKILMKSFLEYARKETETPVLRITGGEPLNDGEAIKRTVNILKAAGGYKKIVLCTNGINLTEAISGNDEVWENIKEALLLKVSLDTMNPKVFKRISRKGSLKIVKENICEAREKGFQIELNLVAFPEIIHCKEDILDVFSFAVEHRLVGLKILTVNDFGGQITVGQSEEEISRIHKILDDVIREMKKKGCKEVNLYLNADKGIQMRRWIYILPDDATCSLTIVDHHNTTTSITPRRTFSNSCRICPFFPDSPNIKAGKEKPCATGIMSLTMRADGVLSPCRLCVNEENTISGKSKTKIESLMNEMLKEFKECFHKTIQGEK